MFDHVLVAEDYEIANQGIVKVLNDEVGIYDIGEAQYCDDAYLMFRKAHLGDKPYQLLITDLSFKEDHKVQTRPSGIELIQDIRKVQSDIKIIVYSQESRPDKINMLFEKLNINGYVCKGQNAIKELVDCIKGVYRGEKVIPQHVMDKVDSDDMIELNDFDIILLEELSRGGTKKEISEKLRKNNIKPCSQSSIDKRLAKMFDDFKAKNRTHLVAIVKDLGLI